MSKQESYNFEFQLAGRKFTINEQSTIQELDEAIIAINQMLAGEHELVQLKKRLYQFMRQHHSFDLYIDECRAELSKPIVKPVGKQKG